MKKRIVIVGGGIIGYCSAYYLSEAGHQVTIIDKEDDDNGCSYKNAGMVVPSHFIPLASPGIIKQGLKWLMKSDSPFYVKPRLDLDLVRWGWLFCRHANAGHVKKYAPILARMNNQSRDLYNELNEVLEDDFSYKKQGLLMLYKTKKVEKEEVDAMELAGKLGIETRQLSNDELNKLDTGVDYSVRGAVYYPGDVFMNPGSFMISLEEKLRKNGVLIIKGSKINSFEVSKKSISGVRSKDSFFQGDEYVISAGVYSSLLAQKLDFFLPMQGGKGYSITLKSPKSLPLICSILVESRVAITPMNGDLRLAGTMEIAGYDLSIKKKRVQGYLKSVEGYIPDFPFNRMDTREIWSGLRPCSPDGIPYLGRTKKYSNLIFATGHSMMGLSLGPVTGKIVESIVNNRDTYPDLNTLSPDRFN